MHVVSPGARTRATRRRATCATACVTSCSPRWSARRPASAPALLAIGARAAAWRAETEAWAATVPAHRAADGAFHVATAALHGYDADGLAVLWPALAARGGVRLDRRGTERLVAFTIRVAAEAAAVGAAIPLAGGIEVVARRGPCVPGLGTARELVLRRRRPVQERKAEPAWQAPVALRDGVQVGRWAFRRIAAPVDDRSPWSAALPAGVALTVRAWRPGDRIAVPGRMGGAARRVKRFLAELHVPAPERAGWPVVVAVRDAGLLPRVPGGDEILWIPGVCRSDAATDRPETPGQHYTCERIDRRPVRAAGGEPAGGGPVGG